jgi:hypothetical protein
MGGDKGEISKKRDVGSWLGFSSSTETLKERVVQF